MIADAHQRVVLVELLDLLADIPFVVVGYLGDVKLVAESSYHCNSSAGLERSDSSYAVVRAVGNVRAEAGAGIAHRSSVLYLEALDGVGIVGAPDLRRIIEHARVESGAAAGAVLKQKVGEIGEQALLDLVNSENIAVPYLALSLGREHLVADLAELTVHVPLYVLDIRG